MGAELLKIAESLAVVVESLRVLAGIQKSENAGDGARLKESRKQEMGWMLVRQVRKVRENAGAKGNACGGGRYPGSPGTEILGWEVKGKLRSYWADTGR